MIDQSDEPRAGSGNSGSSDSKVHRFGRAVVRNPYRTAQFSFFILVTIIILQNLESTSIDVLFWSIADFPKLILIFVSMVVGAAGWELVRRLKR